MSLYNKKLNWQESLETYADAFVLKDSSSSIGFIIFHLSDAINGHYIAIGEW